MYLILVPMNRLLALISIIINLEGMVVHPYNHNNWAVRAGESGIQGHPVIYYLVQGQPGIWQTHVTK